MPLPPASPPPLRPGAVIHGPGSLGVDVLLDGFAAELKRRGFRVGGLVQRNHGPGDDCAERMELVDVATGRAYDITQKLGRESQSCRVDPTGVAEASQAIRNAVAERVDLLVVNKFAGLESAGDGLSDEMLAAIADGIPVLTSVGSRYLNEWQTATGGFCDLLSPTADALWRWWGPHRLYEDLVHGVADAEVLRVVTGAQWVLVETAGGLGVAARQAPPSAGEGPQRWAGRSLRDLAAGVSGSWDPVEIAVGAAALNAHYNRPELEGAAGNGLDLFTAVEGRVVVIGSFPQISRRLPRAQVIDMHPQDGEHPEAACEWLLPGAEAVAMTASSFANRTLPRLLRLSAGARVAMIGPGTPLTPRLFDYGVESLAGFVATDREAVIRTIADGGGSRDFLPYGRMVTLHRPPHS
ncbi:DUF2478 domain-containing protein [Azospirillum picis]|uniref:Uncharacterized protein (DUF4213/DUF364 family) n=1 Tax=Azospirillum picis TaxID=488438 RepID=A0ABU0MGJ0_9PROT|nr:DUF2478 domain-containing protein [Azospirillum picis]MBP2298386.1 uncharacterized protein (DUF4213/DUF364 family) [Azospirillum picis]MDQ0532565.1 uncharacterized protein (DUF4213/DUF364 family) [Azospirillum picis]